MPRKKKPIDTEKVLKEVLREHMYRNIQNLLSEIDELPLKEKVNAKLKLLEFSTPKMQAEKDDTNKNALKVSDVLLDDLAKYEGE